MTSTLELGRPAAYGRKLAARALAKAAGIAAAAALVASVLLGMVSPFELATELRLIAAALVFAAGMRTLSGDFHRARAGVRSEVRVAKVLRKLNAAAVVHGAVIDGRGGDADHIVLGRVAALVETKTGRGRVQVAPDGSMVAGGRRLPKSPVQQARRQAAKVSRATGLPVAAIVCVVDMDDPPLTAGDVTVCSLRALPSVLARLPHVVGPEQAQAAARAVHEADTPQPAAVTR